MKPYAAVYILISILIFSCKTTKFVEKEKLIVDSIAIKQRDAIARVLKEEIERFEKEKEQWEETGVTFETTPCPDSTKTVTKIIFDNGKIKSIEGNVRSLNQSLYEKSSELLDAHTTIDSLGIENEKLQIELSKKQVSTVKEIKRVTFIPWWIWLIAAGTLIAGTFFPQAKRFLKQKLHI